MKIIYIVAVLAIVLLAGCATQPSAPEAPSAPAAAPETPAAPAEEAAAPEAQPPSPAEATAQSATEGEIIVTKAGFDPAELTVKIGSTMTFKAVEGDHKLVIGGTTTPSIKEGTGYDSKFDKAGKISVFDIFTKKSAVVIVTE